MKRAIIATLALCAAMLSTAAHGVIAVAQDPLRRVEPDSARETGMVAPAVPPDYHTDCPVADLAEVSGEQLTELIECASLRYWRDDRAFVVLSEENMIYVAGKAAELVATGGGLDANGIVHKLYNFLWMGYWLYDNRQSLQNQADLPKRFDKDAVDQAVTPALTAIAENEHFTKARGQSLLQVVGVVVKLMDVANVQHLYFPQLTELLRNNWPTLRLDRGSWFFLQDVLNALGEAVGDVSGKAEHEPTMLKVIEVVVDIGLQWTTSDESFYDPALRFLRNIFDRHSTFLRYGDIRPQSPLVLSAAKQGLRQIVDHYEPHAFNLSVEEHSERGDVHGPVEFVSRYYKAIGTVAVNHVRGGLDDFYEELMGRVFRSTFSCGRHIVRSQVVFNDSHRNTQYQDERCRILLSSEELFHVVMDTNENPVPNNFSDSLEVNLVFRLADFSDLFGFAPNMWWQIVGIYMNGKPSVEGNISRVIQNMYNWDGSPRDQTMVHEQAHYLDFRYNHGGFRPYTAYEYRRGLQLSCWVEGFAVFWEYPGLGLGMQNLESRASIFQGYPLGEMPLVNAYGNNFPFSSNYSYCALTFRFLFQRHPEIVTEALDFFYRGDFDGWYDYATFVLPAYESEFRSWLGEPISGGPVPTITRKLVAYVVAAGRIQTTTAFLGEGIVDIDLSGAFSTNQTLTYTVSFDNADTVAGEVAGGRLRLEPLALGTAQVTVAATAPGGESAEQTFTVNVVQGLETRDVAVRDAVSTEEGETAINLASYFTGPALSDVEFTVASNKPDVARVAVRGGRLIITAVAVGQADITLRSVYHGRETTQTFTIAVTGACPSWLCRSGWRWLLLEGSMATVTRDDCDGSDDNDGDFDSATTLALNGQQSGSICPTGDVDYFRIDIEPGYLELNIMGSLDAAAEVHIKHGQQIQHWTGPRRLSGEQGFSFQFYHNDDFVLFVLVRGYDGATGDYTIHAEFTPADADDHGNRLDDATTLALDGQQSGRIDPRQDVDYFRVDVTESGTLTVYTTGSFDTFGWLYSGIGTQITWDRNSGEDTNFRIERRVYAGTYYVAVESEDRSATGDYTIHAEFEPN